MEKEKISVTELTSSISYLLTEGIGIVSVIGELSNFKEHTSGHRYFTLKDESAQISGVMWKSRNLNFVPKDGMKVVIRGGISVYPPRGQYQLDCQTMNPLGQGDLFMAFEEMKAKLQKKGYYDTENKKQIKEINLNIGVSTSPTGAAVKDIFSTLERRFPRAVIHFRPTLVQGEGSAEDIAHAIRELDRLKLDLIIVGRGGGSIEDLWSYNTEIVADAIYKANTPIISAVGHETDFTIADFVSDLRAATPSAAAEIASSSLQSEIVHQINDDVVFANRKIYELITTIKKEIDIGVNSYGFRKIDEKIKVNAQRIDEMVLLLHRLVDNNIVNKSNLLKQNISKLKILEPMNPLKKGFALIKSNNKILNANDKLIENMEYTIQRFNDSALVLVKDVNNN